MANKEQKFIPSQHEETQKRVMISGRNMKKTKVGDGDSEELSNPLPHLVHDIIVYDILTRVPMDSLMRFNCVCKSWYNLTINDSEFIKLHSRRQTCSSSRRFIWILNKNDGGHEYFPSDTMVFFDIDKKEKTVFQVREKSELFNMSLTIEDSLNGLVLLSSEHRHLASHVHRQPSRQYHVYNPITGYSYKLPVRGAFVWGRIDNFYHHLVFDSIIQKYKVLCLYRRERAGKHFLKIVTLDTGNDSWRNVDLPEKMSPCLDDGFTGVFANGSFNWMTRESEILSFDVSNEIFRTVKYPMGTGGSEKIIGGLKSSSKLLEIEGSLGFFEYTNNSLRLWMGESYKGNLKLWVLKEDEETKKNGHQYEWIEMYNIVDMFHSTSVEETLVSPDMSPVIVAGVMHPTPQIIFGVSALRHCWENGDLSQYYSYDVNLKRLDYIAKEIATNHQWHVSSLARL